jgi:hypothetical protein
MSKMPSHARKILNVRKIPNERKTGFKVYLELECGHEKVMNSCRAPEEWAICEGCDWKRENIS